MNAPPAGGGGPASAGGVVGAGGAHVTTPSASHPPLLEKEGSKAGPVILLGSLNHSIHESRFSCRAGGAAPGDAAEHRAGYEPGAEGIVVVEQPADHFPAGIEPGQ